MRLVRYSPPSLPKASFGRPLYSGVRTPISSVDRRSPAVSSYWGWNVSSSASRSSSPFSSRASNGKSLPVSATSCSPELWLDGSLACGATGRAGTGPGAGVGDTVGAGLGAGTGAGSPKPGGSRDSGESCPNTGMEAKSAPRLMAARDICLIRICILLQVVTNNGFFNGLQRLFDIHRSQKQGSSDQNGDKQNQENQLARHQYTQSFSTVKNSIVSIGICTLGQPMYSLCPNGQKH